MAKKDNQARILELKKELLLMVNNILHDDHHDNNIFIDNNDDGNDDILFSSTSTWSYDDAIDRAKQVLASLKELKCVNKRVDVVNVNVNVNDGCPPSQLPAEFCCPLSKHLMKDPVIISTGQTYDRPFIQKWLKAGHRTCPLTQQVLSHTLLTPNYLVRNMISQWCETRGIDFPEPVGYVNEDEATEGDRDHFLMLLNKMSKSVSEQKSAAKELRLLTKKMPAFRALFGESPEAIVSLLKSLTDKRGSWSNDISDDLQEDLITTLLNVSIHDSNKKLVAETPIVIPLLIDALKYGTLNTRSNAAACLFTLSATDSNKVLIGKSGALKPLINLLEKGDALAIKDSASAIFNLCIVQENKARAVREGAVEMMLKKIKDGVHVDELLAILALLSTQHRAIEDMADLEAVECLLNIIRNDSCARNKENCIAILYTICINDRTKLRELREEERNYGTLSKLAKDGTSRTKRKANGILEKLNRGLNYTHTT